MRSRGSAAPPRYEIIARCDFMMLTDFYAGVDREAGGEHVGVVGVGVVLEKDFYGDALDDLDVVAGGVFGGKDGEARARAGLYGIYVAVEFMAREGVHFDG